MPLPDGTPTANEQWQANFQRLLQRAREQANTAGEWWPAPPTQPAPAPTPRNRFIRGTATGRWPTRPTPAPEAPAPLWMDEATPRPEAPAQPEAEVEEGRKLLANNFLVGCDPEFVILSNGDLVNVSRYVTQRGEVGWDHGGSCLELRPKPAMGTLTLVKRIQRLINGESLKAVAPLGKWRGGAMIRAKSRALTLGGHVHLDVDPPGGYNRAHEEEAVARVKGLDRLTATLEGLDILPLTESKERRAGSEYGQFGEIRAYTDNGAKPHLEYRTMASWLNHPVTAMVCLTAAKLAAVSPQVALDTLKPRTICYENLLNFFEFFRHKDLNAKQVLEKLVDGKNIKALQKDPDGDLKDSWKELTFA